MRALALDGHINPVVTVEARTPPVVPPSITVKCKSGISKLNESFARLGDAMSLSASEMHHAIIGMTEQFGLAEEDSIMNGQVDDILKK